MAKLQSRENLQQCACRVGALLLISCVAVSGSRGQAAVGTVASALNSAGIAPQAAQAPAPAAQGLPAQVSPPFTNSASLPAPLGPSVAEANRKALEAGAGKDAAKLLLRSVPSQAAIYIDGMLVGETPLLLIIPPGKHKVEMHGQNGESGEGLVELSPNETKQLALPLPLRYPANITVHPGSGSPSATDAMALTGAVPASASKTAEEARAQDPAALQDSLLAESNRKALEQRAGPYAAKLQLRSVPGHAVIYVDGMLVGMAPQLLTLSPGKHKVEMRGQREETAERLVGILPKETQQVTLKLEVRYPASIVLH